MEHHLVFLRQNFAAEQLLRIVAAAAVQEMSAHVLFKLVFFPADCASAVGNAVGAAADGAALVAAAFKGGGVCPQHHIAQASRFVPHDHLMDGGSVVQQRHVFAVAVGDGKTVYGASVRQRAEKALLDQMCIRDRWNTAPTSPAYPNS